VSEFYPKTVTGALLAVKKAEERVLAAARAFADSNAEQGESREHSLCRIELEHASFALAAADNWVESRRLVGDAHD